MIWPAHRALIYDFILYDTLVSNIYLYTYTCSIEGRGRTFINLACKASTEFFFCLLRGDEEEREKTPSPRVQSTQVTWHFYITCVCLFRYVTNDSFHQSWNATESDFNQYIYICVSTTGGQQLCNPFFSICCRPTLFSSGKLSRVDDEKNKRGCYFPSLFPPVDGWVSVKAEREIYRCLNRWWREREGQRRSRRSGTVRQ